MRSIMTFDRNIKENPNNTYLLFSLLFPCSTPSFPDFKRKCFLFPQADGSFGLKLLIKLKIMNKNKKELVFLRTYAALTAIGMLAFILFAFSHSQNRQFKTIDVERINIVEKDGTVKMLITNQDNFPEKGDIINGRPNHDRGKSAGMLFYNDEGMECGGFIYNGAKSDTGHSAGLSLTFDQYDGDQMMQLLVSDEELDGKRFKRGGLLFNDRAEHETQLGMMKILEELNGISDEQERTSKLQEYKKQGLVGANPRIYLGQTTSKKNGIFLFDDKGKPKARFFVNTNNQAKLEILNEAGDVIRSWPE